MSIAISARNCSNAFQKDLAVIQNLKPDEYQALLTKLSGSSQRFKIWSDNIGAQRRDHRSLQFRLKNVPNLAATVLRYLGVVEQVLAEVLLIATGQKIPWDQLPDSPEDDSSSEGSKDAFPDTFETTELEQLSTYLCETINCLYRITSAIQSSNPFEKYMKSARFEAPDPKPWDKSSVQQNFGDLEPWLLERLCRAISCRRQFLNDRREQHEKRKPGNEKPIIDTESRTVVSSLPTIIKENPMADYGVAPAVQILPAIDLDDNVSEADSLERPTSYAPTEPDGVTRAVPKMPEEGQNGEYFECPLCFQIVNGFYSNLQWKAHAYSDLRPYICLHADCPSPDEAFKKRRQWIEHERSVHRQIFNCIFGCSGDFESASDIGDHLRLSHKITDQSQEFLSSMCISRTQEAVDIKCSLCPKEPAHFTALMPYLKHAAKHLEQAALFSLPRELLDDESDDDIDSEDGEELEGIDEGHEGLDEQFDQSAEGVEDDEPLDPTSGETADPETIHEQLCPDCGQRGCTISQSVPMVAIALHGKTGAPYKIKIIEDTSIEDNWISHAMSITLESMTESLESVVKTEDTSRNALFAHFETKVSLQGITWKSVGLKCYVDWAGEAIDGIILGRAFVREHGHARNLFHEWDEMPHDIFILPTKYSELPGTWGNDLGFQTPPEMTGTADDRSEQNQSNEDRLLAGLRTEKFERVSSSPLSSAPQQPAKGLDPPKLKRAVRTQYRRKHGFKGE